MDSTKGSRDAKLFAMLNRDITAALPAVETEWVNKVK